jgi:hypothetical protein
MWPFLSRRKPRVRFAMPKRLCLCGEKTDGNKNLYSQADKAVVK